MPTGNGPTPTVLYISDEMIAIAAAADFAVLAQRASILAKGDDGSFAADAPWVLDSDTVNFQAQGVAAQDVVSLSGPPGAFPGSGSYLYAVDSASGTSCTLRLLGGAPGYGQPPGAAGLSLVKFSVPSLFAQIDQACYRIKSRFAIDDAIFYRSSTWLYQGVEHAYREFRDAIVFETMADLYEQNSRDQTDQGDFARKAARYRRRADEAIGRVSARWGPTGASEQSTTFFSTKTSR